MHRRTVTVDGNAIRVYDSLVLAAGENHWFGNDILAHPMLPGLKSPRRRARDPSPHLTSL